MDPKMDPNGRFLAPCCTLIGKSKEIITSNPLIM